MSKVVIVILIACFYSIFSFATDPRDSEQELTSLFSNPEENDPILESMRGTIRWREQNTAYEGAPFHNGIGNLDTTLCEAWISLSGHQIEEGMSFFHSFKGNKFWFLSVAQWISVKKKDGQLDGVSTEYSLLPHNPQSVWIPIPGDVPYILVREGTEIRELREGSEVSTLETPQGGRMESLSILKIHKMIQVRLLMNPEKKRTLLYLKSELGHQYWVDSSWMRANFSQIIHRE